MGRKWLSGFVALILLLGTTAIAETANAKTTLTPQAPIVLARGVVFATFVDASPRNVVHVTRIKAGAPVKINAVPAPPNAQGKTLAVTTALCPQAGAIACVNGDFFTRNGVPLGGELVNGQWVKPATAIQQQLWVDGHNRFSIGAAPAGARQSLGATNFPILLPGRPISIPEHDSFADGHYARTLIGWNVAGDAFLVTVEGSRGSRGMSLAQAADLMRRLGATTAVNEDGGGSSQMVVNGSIVGATGARPVANMWAVVV